jgi:transcriptional regulator with XRE-family HTH domain
MDSDFPVIARRLKEARQELGISQYALGVAAGIDEMSASPRVNQYEKGKHAPDFQMVKRLAAVLKVPAAYLYTEDDDLAEALVILGALPLETRKRLIEALRKMAVESS